MADWPTIAMIFDFLGSLTTSRLPNDNTDEKIEIPEHIRRFLNKDKNQSFKVVKNM